MDELGMRLNHKQPMAVAQKGLKKAHCDTLASKGHSLVPMLPKVTPLMVIFEG